MLNVSSLALSRSEYNTIIWSRKVNQAYFISYDKAMSDLIPTKWVNQLRITNKHQLSNATVKNIFLHQNCFFFIPLIM